MLLLYEQKRAWISLTYLLVRVSERWAVEILRKGGSSMTKCQMIFVDLMIGWRLGQGRFLC